MRNSKLGLRALGLAVLGALSMMAVFAAGAQAQGTAGKFLIAGAGFASGLNAPVTGAQEGLYGQLLVAGRGINIKCKKFTVAGGSVNNETDGSGAITFEECAVFSHPADAALPACTVHSAGKANGIIAASALLLPRLHNANRYVLAEPQVAGGSFTTIELLGAACAAEGTYAIKGSVVAEVTAATNNTAKPLLNLSEAIQKLVVDKLMFGAFESFINGSATVELTGGLHGGLTLGVH